MKYNILIWDASSKTLIILNMIKDNQLFYQNKKIKIKKVNLLVDPFLKKPSFKCKIPFISKKIEFIKNIKKTNSFIAGIGGKSWKSEIFTFKRID